MKLARLGYCSSTAYQCSAETRSDLSDNLSDVTHFVADNVDHNTCTLNGCGTFHGMGIISTTTSTRGTFGNVDVHVRRLKSKPQLALATDAIRDMSVKIVRFHKHGSAGLEGIKLCA